MGDASSKTLVLGAGLVGRAMAMDLAADPGRVVTVVDVDAARLEGCGGVDGLHPLQADCSDQRVLAALCAGHDLVLGALPSRFGLQTLQTVIDAGRPFCDISFMPQDARVHHERALAKGVVAVVDCGVAPGMSNLLAGKAARLLDPCRSIIIRVGGLPKQRDEVWDYKAPFSPYDVIEEYLRPARLVRDGAIVIREALSEPVLVEFDGVGTLEAFNTDGLRTLADTLDVPDMTEQTLRWPGHREKALLLRETGLLDETPVEIDGVQVVPRSLTCAKLFECWAYQPGEADFTVMRVEAEGDLDGTPTTLRWDLYDEYDAETGFLSMARTTGFPATIMARCIESGLVDRPGVHPPECLVDQPGLLDHLFAELKRRGVSYSFTQVEC
jgi:saccharopine dehydrogenase-like NADP-dependent oxidoreductase